MNRKCDWRPATFLGFFISDHCQMNVVSNDMLPIGKVSTRLNGRSGLPAKQIWLYPQSGESSAPRTSEQICTGPGIVSGRSSSAGCKHTPGVAARSAVGLWPPVWRYSGTICGQSDAPFCVRLRQSSGSAARLRRSPGCSIFIRPISCPGGQPPGLQRGFLPAVDLT